MPHETEGPKDVQNPKHEPMMSTNPLVARGWKALEGHGLGFWGLGFGFKGLGLRVLGVWG